MAFVVVIYCTLWDGVLVDFLVVNYFVLLYCILVVCGLGEIFLLKERLKIFKIGKIVCKYFDLIRFSFFSTLELPAAL